MSNLSIQNRPAILEPVQQQQSKPSVEKATPVETAPKLADDTLQKASLATGSKATTLSFGDHLGTASKIGLGTMAAGAIVGAIHGAKVGGSGGGTYGAAFGAMLGGGLGLLKGGAIGLAAGTGAGLIYSYATKKPETTSSEAKVTDSSPKVTDAEARSTEGTKKPDFWGDVSTGAVAGTVTGVVVGALIGGAKGMNSGGNFPMMGAAIMGLGGAVAGAGIGLVGGGAAGAIYSKTKD